MEILFLIFWGFWCLVRDFFCWVGRGLKRLGTGRTHRHHINPDSEQPFNDTELLQFDILDDEEE